MFGSLSTPQRHSHHTAAPYSNMGLVTHRRLLSSDSTPHNDATRMHGDASLSPYLPTLLRITPHRVGLFVRSRLLCGCPLASRTTSFTPALLDCNLSLMAAWGNDCSCHRIKITVCSVASLTNLTPFFFCDVTLPRHSVAKFVHVIAFACFG